MFFHLQENKATIHNWDSYIAFSIKKRYWLCGFLFDIQSSLDQTLEQDSKAIMSKQTWDLDMS